MKERFTLIDTKNDRVISSGHSHNRHQLQFDSDINGRIS